MDEELAPAVAQGQEPMDLGDVEPGQFTDPLRFTEMAEMRRELRQSSRQRELRDLKLELIARSRAALCRCRVCRHEFAAWRGDARYCSNACRQRAYRRRHGVSGIR